MMESEEAGATAGQENLEDPEMKKKKLEAVLGKVESSMPLCAMLNAMTKQSFNPT